MGCCGSAEDVKSHGVQLNKAGSPTEPTSQNQQRGGTASSPTSQPKNGTQQQPPKQEQPGTNGNNKATGKTSSPNTNTNSDGGMGSKKQPSVTFNGTGAPAPAAAAAAVVPPKRRVDYFVESVLLAFIRFAATRKQSTKLLRIFLRTLGNHVHNSSTHRTTLDEARRIITTVISTAAAASSNNSGKDGNTEAHGDDGGAALFASFLAAGDELGSVVEQAMEDRGSDEGISRLLDAWTHHNSSNAQMSVDCDSAAAMLRELDLHGWDAVRVQIEAANMPHIRVPSAAQIKQQQHDSPPASPTQRKMSTPDQPQQQQQQCIVTFEHILTWYYDAHCTKEAQTCFHELYRYVQAKLSAESTATTALAADAVMGASSNLLITPVAAAGAGINVAPGATGAAAASAPTTTTTTASSTTSSPEVLIAQWLLADGRKKVEEDAVAEEAAGMTTEASVDHHHQLQQTMNEQPSTVFGGTASNLSAAVAGAAAASSSSRDDVEAARQVAKEFLFRHFGGHIVEENFCSYTQSHRSNSVFDARSVSSVWHDMTQPLPNYLIRSQSVSNEMELSKALADSTRAFLLKLSFNDETGAVVVGGPESALTLKAFCETIRDKGFKKYAFPIIICFPPWETALHSRAREERVAQILNETLGPVLAKGLMFRGATIRDPEFSPATLRHKVLIMAEQAKLNPFVGLYVADMARHGLGVRVTDVKDASPAASGGVLKDDWITRINEDVIEDKQGLRERLSTLRIGEEFTVTRENLTSARVVVGAAVDGADATHASALSNLIFFNYDSSSSGNSPQRKALLLGNNNGSGSGGSSSMASSVASSARGSGGSAVQIPPVALQLPQGHQLYPWETSVIETDEYSSSSLEANNSRPVDHLALVHHHPAASQVADEDGSGNSNSNGGGQNRLTHAELQSARRQEELSLIGVEQFGAQLLDARCSRAAEQWSRGTFVVNGHCGYVLRETLQSTRRTAAEWTIRIIAVPAEVSKAIGIKSVRASVFGRGEEPGSATDNFDDGHGSSAASGAAGAAGRKASSSSVDTASLTATPAQAALTAANGTTPSPSPSTTSSSSSCPFETCLWELAPIRASNHSRIAVEVVFEDNRKLEAVLPAHLLRTGLRAVPFRSLAPEGSVPEREAQELGGSAVDLLCYISKRKIDPAAVAAAEMAAVAAARGKDDDAAAAAASSTSSPGAGAGAAEEASAQAGAAGAAGDDGKKKKRGGGGGGAGRR